MTLLTRRQPPACTPRAQPGDEFGWAAPMFWEPPVEIKIRVILLDPGRGYRHRSAVFLFRERCSRHPSRRDCRFEKQACRLWIVHARLNHWPRLVPPSHMYTKNHGLSNSALSVSLFGTNIIVSRVAWVGNQDTREPLASKKGDLMRPPTPR